MKPSKKDPFDDVWASAKTRPPRPKGSCAWCGKVRPKEVLMRQCMSSPVCEICVDSHGQEKSMKPQIKLIFIGVDCWSRPVYKHWLKDLYFGALDNLFGGSDTLDMIKASVVSSDICFFGSDPEDDPVGTVFAVDYVLEYQQRS